DELQCCLPFGESGDRHADPQLREIFTQARDQNFTAQDNDRCQQRPAMDSLLGAEDQKAGCNQKLVGDRIKHTAERGLLAPNASKIAVEKTRDAGRDKDDEREPAQPKPAMKNVLPEQAADHDRHRDNAAVSQNVRQRRGVDARAHLSLRWDMRRNMSRTLYRRMSGALPSPAGPWRIHVRLLANVPPP